MKQKLLAIAWVASITPLRVVYRAVVDRRLQALFDAVLREIYGGSR